MFPWHFFVCFEGIRCRTTSNRWTKDTQERSIDQRTSSDSIWFFQRRECDWMSSIAFKDFEYWITNLLCRTWCWKHAALKKFRRETMRRNHRSLFVQISVVKIEHSVNDRRTPSLNELQSIMESSTERESIGSECSTQHVSLSWWKSVSADYLDCL